MTSRCDSEGGSTCPAAPEADYHIVCRTYAGDHDGTRCPTAYFTENGKTVTIWNDGDGNLRFRSPYGGTIDGFITRVIAQGDRVKFISRAVRNGRRTAPLKVGLSHNAAGWGMGADHDRRMFASPTKETGTYLVNYKYLSFADAAIQYAFLNRRAVFPWRRQPTGSGSPYLAMSAGGTVRFGIQVPDVG